MASPLRKQSTSYIDDCPEAFEYEDDVTREAVEEIQQRADKILNTDEWVVIDGHDPSK